MAYYMIQAKDKTYSGCYTSFFDLPTDIREYIKTLTYPYTSNLPFVLLISSIRISSEMPYCYTVITRDFIVYHSSDNEETINSIDSIIFPYQHDKFELNYIFKGSCQQIINGSNIVEHIHDCGLQKPYVMKCENYLDNYVNITLFISSFLFYDIVKEAETKGYVKSQASIVFSNIKKYDYLNFWIDDSLRKPYYHSAIQTELEQIFLSMIESNYLNKDLLIREYLFHLFNILGDTRTYHIEGRKKDKQTYILDQLIRRIQVTHGRIRRKDLEAELHYSGDYLNVVLKKYTKMTLTEYRNIVALQYAAYLLTNTNKSVSEICLELSFSDRTYFYKIFKEHYGKTPIEYRNEFRGS